MLKLVVVLSALVAIGMSMHSEPTDFFCNLACEGFEFQEFKCQQKCTSTSFAYSDDFEDCLSACFDLVKPCQDACHEHFQEVFDACHPKCQADDSCQQTCFKEGFMAKYKPA
ncbi:cysteine-rich neurotrophic factor [Aplysia californica]|uniref:Cysteine-rich neurotrophic factor n=1 Tax=Aplysia californica TaxID=6500 RepID=A0ABM0JES5_APLCA|nr:cysteine-rich neurotrophic factor [Aplysia californica]XP_005092072.1 cysteine-rich neurotrophic factor [Aplysia californica]